MEFNKIIAVTGKPGLYQVVSQTKSGIIAESLSDKKRFPVSTAQNVSLLENIAIYTYEEEVSLLNVFKKMYEVTAGKSGISHKESSNKLTSFFVEVLPNYDDERVYTSNIKKVIQWFNLLVEAEMDFSKIEATKEEEDKKEV
jgi:hypothetical protein